MKYHVLIFTSLVIHNFAFGMETKNKSIPAIKTGIPWDNLTPGNKLDLLLEKYQPAIASYRKTVNEKIQSTNGKRGTTSYKTEEIIDENHSVFEKNGIILTFDKVPKDTHDTGPAYLIEPMENLLSLLEQSNLKNEQLIIDCSAHYNADHALNKKIAFTDLHVTHEKRKSQAYGFAFGALAIGSIWAATKAFVWWKSRKAA
ncbi:MAG TPA: hypothetical protein VHO47_04420 [Candidatus Babeliales bacterium]|nr:hypothetical protein [Candidatus Babeliales bacterium]